jgi:hypothetical protein
MKSLSRAFVVLSLVVLGCDEKPESPKYPDLRIYLDRFEEEAKARGYDFDLTNVQVAYLDEVVVNNVTYCGYGYNNFGGTGLRRIEISKAVNCGWLALSDIERENFIFHEIGHAFFNRPHDDAMLCDGAVASLMTGGPNYLKVYTAPGDERDYYIRELIDPLVANTKCIQDAKDWSKDSVFYKISKNDHDWILYTDNGKYVGTRSTPGEPEEYLTLASIPAVNAEANAYWFKSLNSPNIPECAEVKFKVKMNSESLTGIGAAISVRVYKSTLSKYGALTEQYLRVSTEDDASSGKLIDVPQALLIPCYSRATTQLLFFVVLRGQTQGKVTFNDIEVVVKPQ